MLDVDECQLSVSLDSDEISRPINCPSKNWRKKKPQDSGLV